MKPLPMLLKTSLSIVTPFIDALVVFSSTAVDGEIEVGPRVKAKKRMFFRTDKIRRLTNLLGAITIVEQVHSGRNPGEWFRHEDCYILGFSSHSRRALSSHLPSKDRDGLRVSWTVGFFEREWTTWEKNHQVEVLHVPPLKALGELVDLTLFLGMFPLNPANGYKLSAPWTG
uniref:Uncharacterized protein n=1 Tax=Timema poppense TaxID=170557 RepID=A0A7R9H6I3_TIMPO|nr:unnamed protein product [Timema poppensis]